MAGEENNQEINLDGVDLSAFEGAAPEPGSVNLEGIDLQSFGDFESAPVNFKKVGTADLSQVEKINTFLTDFPGGIAETKRASGPPVKDYMGGTPPTSLSESSLKSISQEELDEKGRVKQKPIPAKNVNNDQLFTIVRNEALRGSPIFSTPTGRDAYVSRLADKGYDRQAIKEIVDVGSALASKYNQAKANLQENPQDVQSVYELGNIALATRDYKGAEKAFSQVANSDDPNIALMGAKQMGRVALIKKDNLQALNIYQNLAKTNPDDPEITQGLSRVMYMMGEESESQQLEKKAKDQSDYYNLPESQPTNFEQAKKAVESGLMSQEAMDAMYKEEGPFMTGAGAGPAVSIPTPESQNMKALADGLEQFYMMSTPGSAIPVLAEGLFSKDKKVYDERGVFKGIEREKGSVEKTIEGLSPLINPYTGGYEKAKGMTEATLGLGHTLMTTLMMAGAAGIGPGQWASPSVGTLAKTYGFVFGPQIVSQATGSDLAEKIAFEPITTASKGVVDFINNNIPYLRDEFTKRGIEVPEDDQAFSRQLMSIGDLTASLALIGSSEEQVAGLFKRARKGYRNQKFSQQLSDAINSTLDNYNGSKSQERDALLRSMGLNFKDNVVEGKDPELAAKTQRIYESRSESPIYQEPTDVATDVIPEDATPEKIEQIKSLSQDSPIDQIPNNTAVEYNGMGGFLTRDAETQEYVFVSGEGKEYIIAGGGDLGTAESLGVTPMEGYYKDKHGEFYVRRHGNGYMVYKIGENNTLKPVYTNDKGNLQRRDAIINKALDPDRNPSIKYTQELKDQAAQLEAAYAKAKAENRPSAAAIGNKLDETNKRIADMERENTSVDAVRAAQDVAVGEIEGRIQAVDQDLASDIPGAVKPYLIEEKNKLEQTRDEIVARDVPDEVPAEGQVKAEQLKELRSINADELKTNPEALEGDPGQYTTGYPESFQTLGTSVKTLESQGYTNLKTGDRVAFDGDNYVVKSLTGDNKKPNTGVSLIRVDEQGKLLRESDKKKPQTPEGIVDQTQAQAAMDEMANRLVEIEGEFSLQNLTIDTDYDNQIIIQDREGNIIEPDELPGNLSSLAAEYEGAVSKMGEYDNTMMQQALNKARGEEVPFEEVKPQLPLGETKPKQGFKKWSAIELGNKTPVEVMNALAEYNPSMRKMMDIAIKIHNKLKEIEAKAGGDILAELRGMEKDKFRPFSTDLYPFPYRMYSQLFNSKRAERFKNFEESYDLFIQKLEAAEKYLENPPTEQELAQKKQAVTEFYNNKVADIKKQQAEAAERIKAARGESKDIVEQEFPRVNQDFRSNKYFKAIVDKYKKAKALIGRSRMLVVPDGSKIQGTYKVVDAFDIAPSHNPDNYSKTKGVPVDENGNTLNDRNYESDKQAQQLNAERAAKYDRRAVDKTIFVTEDGIVMNGNDRTMSRQKSAKLKTDSDYVEGLMEDAEMYGIDPADIQKMVDEGKNPTLIFEIEGEPKYNTKEYARFNEQDIKGQNPLEKAVALSKKVSAETTNRISTLLDGISNSSEIVGREVLASLRKVLVDDGVISKNDIPTYFDADGKMTAAGKDFLENLVLATVFDEPTLRSLNQEGVKSWRAKLANAKFDLMQNTRLGEYNIQDMIKDAVGLRKEQLDSNMPLFDWLSQTNMFREPVDPYTAMVMAMLEMPKNSFKDFVKSVNERAKTESVPDMFGEVSTPEQVVSKALKETLSKLEENEKVALERLFAIRAEKRVRDASKGDEVKTTEGVPETAATQPQGAGVEVPPSGTPEGQVKPTVQEKPVEQPTEQIKFARNDEEVKRIQSELDDLLGEFGGTLEMGGLSKIDKLVPAIAKIVQLGYYKIADVAKFLVEKGLNAALPYLKEAYRKFKNTYEHDAEVKTSLSGDKEIEDYDLGRVAGGLAEGPQRATGGRELPGQPGGPGLGRRPPIRIANKENIPPISKESVVDGKYDIDETQRFGINLAMQRFDQGGKGFLLADGAGVGKTREILVIAREMADKSKKPSLIVTLKAVIDDSIKKDSKALGLDMENIEIGTYDDLRAGKIGKGDYGVVIFDESHNLKNINSERATAAAKIKRDNTVFASATPMDKPEHAVYFMAELTGEDPKKVESDLGIEVTYVADKYNPGEYRSFARFTAGFDTYIARLIDKRNNIIEKGGMVRREYPFYGDVKTTSIPMPAELTKDINMVNEIMDKRYEDRENIVIGRWAGEMTKLQGGRFLDNYSKIKKMVQNDKAGSGAKAIYMSKLRDLLKSEGRNRLEAIDKLVEPAKADHVLDETKKALAEGKKVVVVVSDVGDQNIKIGNEKNKEKYGYLERKITETLPVILKKKFEEAGIKSAEIYGGNRRIGSRNKYDIEMERFNKGDADVVVMTAKSGGTGINLDDTVGDKPRKMIIATVDYQGDVLEQTLGRVSRRNTASPAEVVMPMMEGAASDNNRRSKVAKKVGVLAAINTGKGDIDYERINLGHLMAQEEPGMAAEAPAMEKPGAAPEGVGAPAERPTQPVSFVEPFKKLSEPNVRMAERSRMLDTEFGNNGERAKYIYENYQSILRNLNKAKEKGDLDINFEGDCI